MRGLLAAVMASLAVSAPSDARTWVVGGAGADFPLIGSAIAAASGGDRISVRGGVYREDLVVDKPLAIVGEGEPVLSGTGAGTVVTILAPGSTLRGFLIEGSGAGATNRMDAAVHVQANDTRIVGNRMRRVFYGVVIANATRSEIADNDIEGLAGLTFSRRGDGIYVYRAPGNLVARNRIRGARDGIYFQYAPRGRAVGNVVTDSRYALHDMFSDDARIEGNTFSGSSAGANIMNSRRITIERNRMIANRGVSGVGLTLKECDDSVVQGNELTDNLRGMLIDGSSQNRFLDNVLRANDTAILLFPSAEQNVLSGNQFRDNWSDLVLSGRDSSTRWSLGGRGNYWSRYRGFDFDGDGLGDAPHRALGAFEQIEGANPSARIFLQSPAAAGLELAARLSNRQPAGAVDEHPLVRPPAMTIAVAEPLPHHPWPAAVLLALVGALAVALVREASPCSR